MITRILALGLVAWIAFGLLATTGCTLSGGGFDSGLDADVGDNLDGWVDSGGGDENGELEEEPCLSNCGERECGLDPVCGTQICGECSDGLVCNNLGRCVADGSACRNSCECPSGQLCDIDGSKVYCRPWREVFPPYEHDICCLDTENCYPDYPCENPDGSEGTCPGGCTPDCNGKSCGDDDSCGGRCTECPVGRSCDTETWTCTGCNADCTGRCGGPDGCGGQCPDTCPDGQSCQPPGYTNCAGCQPDCKGKFCGDEDGCGGWCTDCPAGQSCNQSTRQCEQCVPDCVGRECGPDGCGGSCGECVNNDVCNMRGVCVVGGGGCGDSCDCASGLYCDTVDHVCKDKEYVGFHYSPVCCSDPIECTPPGRRCIGEDGLPGSCPGADGIWSGDCWDGMKVVQLPEDADGGVFIAYANGGLFGRPLELAIGQGVIFQYQSPLPATEQCAKRFSFNMEDPYQVTRGNYDMVVKLAGSECYTAPPTRADLQFALDHPELFLPGGGFAGFFVTQDGGRVYAQHATSSFEYLEINVKGLDKGCIYILIINNGRINRDETNLLFDDAIMSDSGHICGGMPRYCDTGVTCRLPYPNMSPCQ
ncbi:MAG: hypothetical protein GXP49_08725 [Deltaproteobacteria bacterium]|nr:hypothetical protein [Deltaproteobacteria bacterium]